MAYQIGTESNDTLIGGDDADRLVGQGGDDSLAGLGGDDTLCGTGGNDSMFGGSGFDDLQGGAGNDLLDGGADWDVADYVDSAAPVSVDLRSGLATGEGNDTLVGIENVWGSSQGDTVYGDGGRNLLSGEGGNDLLYGGEGADWLTGGAGDDLVDGGEGVDTANFRGADDGNTLVDLTAGISVGPDGNDTLVGIENVSVFSGNSTMVGSEADNSLENNGANAVMQGNGGNDTLYGGFGTESTAVFRGSLSEYSITFNANTATYTVADSVAGRDGSDEVRYTKFFQFSDGTHLAADFQAVLGTAGDDVMVGTDSGDVFKGLAGNDNLQGFAGNDLLWGGAGDDTLDGGTGDDTASYGDASDGIAIDLLVAGGQSTGSSGVDTLISIENLVGGGGDDNFAGTFGRNHLQGGAGNDTLDGRQGADFLEGGTGNDTFHVDDLFDYVKELPDEGVDTIVSTYSGYGLPANVENLTLEGDAITGYGNALSNVLTGTDGYNTFIGHGGNDTMFGAGGDDMLIGDTDGESTAVYRGNLVEYAITYNESDDTYTVTDSVDGRDGSDTLSQVKYFQFADTTYVAEHVGEILGTAGDDILSGTDHGDALKGLSGDDYLWGGLGDDSIDGGEGTDWAAFGGLAGATQIVDLQAGTASGPDGNDTLVNIEWATVNHGDSVLIGSEGANYLYGGEGVSRMQGNGGDDILDSAPGYESTAVFRGNPGDYTISHDVGAQTYTVTDTVAGRDGSDQVRNAGFFEFAGVRYVASQFMAKLGTQGNDTLNGTGNGDVLKGLAGNDKLLGGAGDDMLWGGAGDDTLDGGAGNDTASYEDAASNLVISLAVAKAQVTGLGRDLLIGIENVVGGSGNDKLVGSDSRNVITGGFGNDTLDGGGGVDLLIGGAGDDTYYFDNLSDFAVENAGEGFDTAFASKDGFCGENVEKLVLTGIGDTFGIGNGAANIIVGNAGKNLLVGNAGDDTLLGGAGNDSLHGDYGNDSLDGGTGADSMDGGAGDDIYVVDSLLDSIVEEADCGTDTVFSKLSLVLSANVENLTLTGTSRIAATGNASNNTLIGNSVANAMSGGEGADTLDGAAGTDTLTGGGGADVFTLRLQGADRIADFHAAEDRIALDHLAFKALAIGSLAADAFQSGATSVASGAAVHLIYNTATGALLYDADGLGGAKAVTIATFDAAGLVGSLSAADFVVI